MMLFVIMCWHALCNHVTCVAMLFVITGKCCHALCNFESSVDMLACVLRAAYHISVSSRSPVHCTISIPLRAPLICRRLPRRLTVRRSGCLIALGCRTNAAAGAPSLTPHTPETPSAASRCALVRAYCTQVFETLLAVFLQTAPQSS